MDHGDARSRLPRLPPVRRRRMYEVLADHIVDFVEAQGLAPGQRLPPERALAEQLGVSRATLSQALVALEVKGVVDVRHGDGAVLVPPGDRRHGRTGGQARCAGHGESGTAPSRAAAEEALAALLPALAALAAQRREEDGAAALDAAVTAITAVPGAVGADGAPGAAVADSATTVLLTVLEPLSRSPVVAAMARQAARLVEDAQGALDPPARSDDDAVTAAAVLHAVARGDAGAAREAAAAHVRRRT